MAYKITIEVADKGGIVPWYDIFEKGCCAGCPNNFYDRNENQTICGIMGMALPVGYDHDQNPWELCPIVKVEHIDKKIPKRIGKYKWLRPDWKEREEVEVEE